MRAHPTNLRLAVVLAGLTAAAGLAAASPAASPVPQAEGARTDSETPGRWASSIELGLGSRLDIATGRLLAPGEAADGVTVELVPVKVDVADPLQGRTAMRFASDGRIQLWRPAGQRPPATFIARPPASTTGEDPEAIGIGAEYVLLPVSEEGGAPATDWGYLRVLDVGPKTVRIELCSAPSATEALVRDPVLLTVDAEPAGHRLRWSSPEVRASGDVVRYQVRRRVLGPAEPSSDEDSGDLTSIVIDDGFGPWESIVDLEATTYLDGDAPKRRVAEYAVVRVDASGRPVVGALGGVARTVRVETPGEWPLEVGLGARIDLITGRVAGPGDPAHLEIGRSAPGSLAVKPLAGTRLALTAKAALDPQGMDWWIPPARDRRFISGRTGILQDGGEIEFVLPGGIVGRLSAESSGGENWRLRRQVGLGGQRLLPRPPEPLPSIEVRPGAGSEVDLSFEQLAEDAGVDPSVVSLVVERELAFGLGDWAVLQEAAPGERSVGLSDLFTRTPGDPLEGDLPVVRLRVRQRIAFGASSHPSAPFDVLASGPDDAARASLLEDAIVCLDDPSFQRRMEARAVLHALGEDARPALEAAAIADLGTRGVAARAVLEAIEAGDTSGRGAARRLRRRALEVARSNPELDGLDAAELDAWVGAVPDVLVVGGPEDRAHGLLVFVDRAERGVMRMSGPPGDVREDCLRAQIWAGAVGVADADSGVRWLASFLAELGPEPSLASFEPNAPSYLIDPKEREDFGPLPGGSWIELPASAEELAWQLERRPELGDLDLGPPLAQLLHALRDGKPSDGSWADGGDERFFDYDVRSAELVLRLVERARDGAETRAMLDAASALFPGEDRVIAAWREVSDRRLASPSAASVSRRSILLDAADLDLLEVALDDLAGDGDLASGGAPAGVDVLLPPGVYGDEDLAAVRTIDMRRSGIRLRPAIPGERVEIRASVRVRGAQNVAFEDIEITSAGGSALSVMEGGHAVAIRCHLAGAGSAIYLQDGDLELAECVVDGADLAKPPQWAVRELGACRLFARATLFEAGTLFLSDEGRNWLDRCVVDAGQRTLVQSQRAGHLVARETLLRGTNLGLYNIETGVLAAVVIDVARDPLGRRPSKLRLSPRLFHLVGEGQRAPAAMKLTVEPLRPR